MSSEPKVGAKVLDSYVLEVRPRLDPTSEPVAWVLIRIEEQILSAHEGRVTEAALRVHCLPFSAQAQSGLQDAGYFAAHYSEWGASVSIAADGYGASYTFLEVPRIRGNRIGGHMQSILVAWVKQWPAATVRSIELAELQAADAENRERRNRFWRQIGLTFVWNPGQDGIAGRSVPIPVADLRVNESWTQNISKVTEVELLAKQLGLRQDLQFRLERSEKRRDSVEKLLKEERGRWAQRPWRSFAALLWARYGDRLMGALIVAGAGAAIVPALWRHFR